MTAPVLPIVWSYRLSFLFVTCLTFIVLAFVIFTLPRHALRFDQRSKSALVNKKQEPLEPPREWRRRILSVYSPAALVAMAEKGIPPSILGALQNPSVESIGRSVVIVSTVDPGLENEAKEFQEAIFDQIVKGAGTTGEGVAQTTSRENCLG